MQGNNQTDYSSYYQNRQSSTNYGGQTDYSYNTGTYNYGDANYNQTNPSTVGSSSDTSPAVNNYSYPPTSYPPQTTDPSKRFDSNYPSSGSYDPNAYYPPQNTKPQGPGSASATTSTPSYMDNSHSYASPMHNPANQTKEAPGDYSNYAQASYPHYGAPGNRPPAAAPQPNQPYPSDSYRPRPYPSYDYTSYSKPQPMPRGYPPPTDYTAYSRYNNRSYPPPAPTYNQYPPRSEPIQDTRRSQFSEPSRFSRFDVSSDNKTTPKPTYRKNSRDHRSPSYRRSQSRRRSPSHRRSPSRRSGPDYDSSKRQRIRSPSRHHRSPSRHRSRHHSRSESRSPSPVAGDIIPSRVFFNERRCYSDLHRDFPSLHICKDFTRLVSCWQNDDQSEVPLFGTVKLTTRHMTTAIVKPTSEALSLNTPFDPAKVRSLTEGITHENAKYRINVKFALFSGMDVSNLDKLEKGEETFNHLIRFLVMKASNKDQIFLSGGVFGLVNSLEDVSDELLIGKAIEYGREQLHVDLSQCSHWIRMMEVWYKRTETSRGEKCDYQEVTVVFMPDLWSGAPVLPTLLEVVSKSTATPEPSTDVIAAEAAAAAVFAFDEANALKEQTEKVEENMAALDEEAKSVDNVICSEESDSENVENETSVKPMEEEDHVPESATDTVQETNVGEPGVDDVRSMEEAPEAASSEVGLTVSEMNVEQPATEATETAATATATATVAATGTATTEVPAMPQPTTQPSNQTSGTPEQETSDVVLTPRDNPNAGLTEVEEVDCFGRIVHRTVSRSVTLSVITTYNDSPQPKAKILSLDGLLDYTEKDVSEKIFEVSLLAETFRDMILQRFARVIMQGLTDAVDTRVQIQNLAVVGETNVKEPMEEGEIPKPSKGEEVKNGPIHIKVNRDMYVACQYFDKKNKGYLSQSELLNILLNANLVCSRGEAEMIVNQVMDGSKFDYLKLFKSTSSLIVCLVVHTLIFNDHLTLIVLFAY